ncbi:MAG: GAF domain-containing protein [Candidatus Zixiibacteriota bacterium]|nr:MAG: GAF domain-containing protein [candidate division Zixibacteria bacterium]
MDTFEKELKRIQSRDWQIWILMLTVLLILTTFILLVVFYSDLQRLYEEQIDARMFNFLLLGFVALSLLFIGYVVLKEISLKRLQRELMAQRVASRRLERHIAGFQTVHDLTSLVNSEMILSDVFDSITSKALSALGGDQCSLFLLDPEIGKLRCVSVWGPKSEEVRDAIVEVGKSVAGWVIEHGEPLYLDGELKDSQFRELVKKDKKITSSLCLPLKVKDETKGVLNISLFADENRFSESDLNLASKFAEHAAIAVDRAGLYDKLKKQTKTLRSMIKEMGATQGQLAEPGTLRALSNLASGMAHDFTNSLTTILDKIELTLEGVEGISTEEHDKKERVLDWLKATQKLARGGVETAKHVQIFARTFQMGSDEGKDVEGLDINAIVSEALEKTRVKWTDEAELKGIRIEIETDLGALANPTGNYPEIKDVLTSMIFNSIDALPQGGKINIATGMRGDRVEIKVADNGSGMSEDVRARIFEPFFTTKEEKGRGIGLSVAHGIISRHNGDITVESEPGKGTTFTITLPVFKKSEAEAEGLAPAESPTQVLNQ